MIELSILKGQQEEPSPHAQAQTSSIFCNIPHQCWQAPQDPTEQTEEWTDKQTTIQQSHNPINQQSNNPTNQPTNKPTSHKVVSF